MKRGFDLSVAVAPQALQMAGGGGFVFNFLVRKALRSSFQEVVVRKNLNCRLIFSVFIAADPLWSSTCRRRDPYKECSLEQGSGFLFPGVPKDGEKTELALTQGVSMEDKRAVHTHNALLPGVGGAARYTSIDGTAMDVLKEQTGRKPATVARRYV